MNKIEKLENQLKYVINVAKQIKSELAKLKEPKFEVGKWYKSPNGRGLWFAKKITTPPHGTFLYGYGWHSNDLEWVNDDMANVGCVVVNKWIEATDKEVEEALIKEAKKRGFKEGATIESVQGSKGMIKSSKIEAINHKNQGIGLYVDKGKYEIFLNGNWAEIIEEEKVIINGYEMKVDGDIVSFGCAKFHKSDLRRWLQAATKDRCDTNRHIKSITLDIDVTITIDQLKQVVESKEFNK